MSDLDAEMALPGLVGTTPLGLLAALGVLDVVDRQTGGGAALSWTAGLEPHALLHCEASLCDVLQWVDEDRRRWAESPLLTWGPSGALLSDVKPREGELHDWAAAVLARTDPDDRATADLFCALVAEGAVAGKGDAKPTHLHFTAGQQKFLVMVRGLAEFVGLDEIREAIVGPWEYASSLPSLSWYSRGERIYALRGFDPGPEKRLGVPGADWLGFLGLTFLPVAERSASLRTTGCSPGWKSGTFTWPLWTVPIRASVVRSLLGRRGMEDLTPAQLRQMGISQIQRAPIRRSDQGGYGSFGPATPHRTAATAP